MPHDLEIIILKISDEHCCSLLLRYICKETFIKWDHTLGVFLKIKSIHFNYDCIVELKEN